MNDRIRFQVTGWRDGRPVVHVEEGEQVGGGLLFCTGGATMPKIEPAMTEDEWATINPGGDYRRESAWGESVGRHEAAARALHNQPFGFRRLGVVGIRCLIEHARKTAEPVGPMHALWDSISWAEDTADRIEGLLPPEEK